MIKRARFQHTKYSNTVFYFDCSDADWALIRQKFEESQAAKEDFLQQISEVWKKANELMDLSNSSMDGTTSCKYLKESFKWKRKADKLEAAYKDMLQHPQFGIEEFVKICAERGIGYTTEYEYDSEKGAVANIIGKIRFKVDPLCKSTKN